MLVSVETFDSMNITDLSFVLKLTEVNKVCLDRREKQELLVLLEKEGVKVHKVCK